jgi:hypothetical protein
MKGGTKLKMEKNRHWKVKMERTVKWLVEVGRHDEVEKEVEGGKRS